jgi:hypothetical protein
VSQTPLKLQIDPGPTSFLLAIRGTLARPTLEAARETDNQTPAVLDS